MPKRNELHDVFTKYDLTGGLNDGKVHNELCWPWKGSLNDKGIAVFSYRGKSYYAHRVSYHVAHPTTFPLDDPRLIRHVVCNNNHCGNFNHMVPGTHQQNMTDAVNSKRFGLTNDEISAIMELLTTTDLTHQRIAERISYKFGRKIARQTVTDINTNRRSQRRKVNPDAEATQSESGSDPRPTDTSPTEPSESE